MGSIQTGRMRAGASVLAVTLILGCARGAAGTPGGPEWPGLGKQTFQPVPERYAFLYSLGTGGDEEPWKALPFRKISLQRTGCYGTCPVYKVELLKGGKAVYEGKRYAPRVGVYQGEVHPYHYGLLSFLLERFRFMEMRDSYSANWTDDETVILSVETDDGGKKRVSDYGRQGPPELQALIRVIDSMSQEIRWQLRSKAETDR